MGPLAVRRAGADLDLGPPKRRVLVVRLLLEEGRAVSIDRLCEDLWAGRPPSGAVASLQANVSRIRSVLEPRRLPHGKAGLLVRESRGYALRVPRESLDTVQFEHGVRQAAHALARGRVRDARREVERALTLWRGTPLEDARDYPFATRYAAQMEAAWGAAEELHICTLVHDAAPQLAVTAAEALTARQPLREVAWSLLMCALYLTGRHADALARFEQLRAYLSSELGLLPGPRIRGLQEAILRHDFAFIKRMAQPGFALGHDQPELHVGFTPEAHGEARPAADVAPAAVGPPGPDPLTAQSEPNDRLERPAMARPAQLPADSAFFTGRQAELDLLHDLLPDAERGGTAPSITVIGGVPGVGKTTLALHFAHQVSDRFPDGQLFVDLNGFGADGPAMDPEEALHGFLTALGVSLVSLPSARGARTALLRTLLARLRVLIVLDNARDENQVRPLLPAAPGCMAIVTSRNQLHGLVTMEGVQALNLDVPPVSEGREVLTRRLGAIRVRDEPQAVEEIISSCARLPLALAIAAARATLHPGFSLRSLADEMRATKSSLDAWSGTDDTADVRTVFSWSYQALTPPAARLFRLLALHPGPDVSTAAAASLAGLLPSTTRRLLTELTRTRMINETRVGRFVFHDLLKTYARELTQQHETNELRDEASRRMYNHYLHTASAGDPRLGHDVHNITEPSDPVTPERFVGLDEMMRWYCTEERVLQACLRQEAETGLDSYACQLAWPLYSYLTTQGRSFEAIAVLSVALAAAERGADSAEQSRLHRAMAASLGRMHQHEEAFQHLDTAEALVRAQDVERARVHLEFAALPHNAGQDYAALLRSLEALRLAEQSQDRLLEAESCNAVGWSLTLLGRHLEALPYCRRSVECFRPLDVPQHEAYAWASLGHVRHHLRDYEAAVDCYRTALDLMTETGDAYTAVGTLLRLGDTHLHAGDRETARAVWQRARQLVAGRPEAPPSRISSGG
ncbi:tetratricopeptide repeat protein [Streptomyces sp. PSKA01]|uniref:Tetratricopeptide repeat protein n=2 Tax=Streptomyces cupreus TaxID=2759956 RepID=A0A7X1MAZ9_9ACTN|nr:BTAD domain-containing putative transcriptional regulator [Streptomyces cupreus]MBC2904687.1 tetratricopeptide repeat protein [Streptomyces cupreus]